MNEPTCVVTGVGPGTGAALVRRFAEDGYRVAMLARDAARLEELAAEIPQASPFPVDVADLDALRRVLAQVRSELGPPSVLLHNAVAGGFGSFESVKPEELEHRFRVNVTSLLVLAQELAPKMIEAGRGAIVVTGNTSAWRGKAGFAGFAPTKAAQRILAESLARSLGPQGIHVAYVVIDAVIDVPWTRRAFADRPDEFFIKPAGIADAVHHLVHQERSAWTFELDLRPYGESW
jgi:NAD(P)-dependent dehydrogenase (short-subunit alcohol dehydrogenase family)